MNDMSIGVLVEELKKSSNAPIIRVFYEGNWGLMTKCLIAIFIKLLVSLLLVYWSR